MPFQQRWRRFDEAIRQLKVLLSPGTASGEGTDDSVPVARLISAAAASWRDTAVDGSWGSAAGLRRVACLGDGWLASAYNTTPEAFAVNLKLLRGQLERQDRLPGGFPHALVTMWTWITDKRSDAERVLSQIVGPLVNRDPAQLRGRVCVGSAEESAQLLSRLCAGGLSARPFGRWAMSGASLSSLQGRLCRKSPADLGP